MYMFLFLDLVWNHVEDESVKDKIENSPVLHNIFENLVIGVNVVDISYYNDIAKYISGFTDEEAKNLTYGDVIKNVGEYYDSSGALV